MEKIVYAKVLNAFFGEPHEKALTYKSLFNYFVHEFDNGLIFCPHFTSFFPNKIVLYDHPRLNFIATIETSLVVEYTPTEILKRWDEAINVCDNKDICLALITHLTSS